jgi:branched-chain amino acid transport system substrate-binding protein
MMPRIGEHPGLVAATTAALLAVTLLCGCPPPAAPESGSPTVASTSGGQAPSDGVHASASVQEGSYGDRENGIPVGAYFGLTGAQAVFGQDSAKAMILALEEMEAADWNGGPSIHLILQDDRCKTEDVGLILNKLINDDEVVAVVGELASSLSLVGAPICQEEGVPMLSPSSTNPEVTKKGDFIFRTCFTDQQQGYACAKFAFENLEARRAAILYPGDNDYSVGLANDFTAAFGRLGGEVVLSQGWGKDQQDFSVELDRAKQQEPDVLFVPCYYDDSGQLASQARKRGLDIPIVGGDGWDSPDVDAIGKEATNNCFFANHYSKADESPIVQSFVKSYEKRWGEAPSAMAATAYDGVRILVQAIRSVSEPRDRLAVRDALAATSGFEGVTGTITIDEDRNATKSAVILELRDGEQTFVDTVQPDVP